MIMEQSADQDASNTAAVDSQHHESRDSDAMNVPDAEQARHDLFHAAVKRVLERHDTTLNRVLKSTDEKESRYKSLLTSSELRFLLK
ncbi:hypothetical protein NLA06_07000 [Desulfomicrobium sp. ZS1]|jgi:hypothetical protein|uniref:hypothetical protein n=1 Tax=Desulfomicrobium sp. ZS1 TaxID=2952228 RepID=UPI0020B1C9F0|nr:hypothetical protein [Desulfomicrobium sp. ZS1]UTF51629.1 hypothetical protein NLA06_07000 [Desulfomicrobium sp. ZS1]